MQEWVSDSVVVHLPSMCKAMNLIPTLEKQKSENSIQQHIQKVIHYDQVVLAQEYKVSLTSKIS
jgi:hypothetical protein